MDTNWFKLANESEIPSPALLIYVERAEENIRRMIALARDFSMHAMIRLPNKGEDAQSNDIFKSFVRNSLATDDLSRSVPRTSART